MKKETSARGAAKKNESAMGTEEKVQQLTYLEMRRESSGEKEERELQYEVEDNLRSLIEDISATSRELNKAQRNRDNLLRGSYVSWSDLVAEDKKIEGFIKGLERLKEYREIYFPNWLELVTEQ